MIIFSYFLFISTDWFYAFLLSSSHPRSNITLTKFYPLSHPSILLQPTLSPVLSNPFIPPPPRLTPSALSLYIFIPLTTLFLSSSHPSFSTFHSTFSTNVLITLSHNTLASGISHYRLTPPLTRPTCSTHLIRSLLSHLLTHCTLPPPPNSTPPNALSLTHPTTF